METWIVSRPTVEIGGCGCDEVWAFGERPCLIEHLLVVSIRSVGWSLSHENLNGRLAVLTELGGFSRRPVVMPRRDLLVK